jgi:DNA-binding beta-propeller fold protein YncE
MVAENRRSIGDRTMRGGNASKSLFAGVVRLALLLSLVVVSGSGVRADPVLTHVNVYVANSGNNTVSVIAAARSRPMAPPRM